MNNKQYDVLIVGGGMVGAALACGLAQNEHGRPLSVAVVEAREPDLRWPPADYDIRVSAITRASQRIFENIGAWKGMVRRRVSPYRDMHVWDATGSGVIHFDAAELGEPDLGHIIENSVIQAALVEHLQQFTNIDYLCPLQLSTVEWTDEGVTITTASGEQLNARLLVGADGGRSWVREQAGIQVKGWAYDQTAVVCTVSTEKSHQLTAWQRFMPTGPVAFLPLDDGSSSIVWSTSPQQAEALLTMDEGEFCTQLGRALDGRLGQVTHVGQRGAFPLRLQHASEYVRPGLALVGDAAHSIHPLAGQGVNLGLADAATLVQIIQDALVAKEDFGSLAVLRRYERWRKADNLTMLASMDGFKRLFSNNRLPLRWLRNLGLSLTNALAPVKNNIIRFAMGLNGTLPRLAKRRPL
ncbi:MAG: UbiH/UbiF/VisC/COQ6 family ubiquinone biosynthesis hydroxylase [Gammaproteobacteria bacterium]|nr:UbiH/UbiF/VisC/COQ6 family ubiquinone biosynthesis hydroxylase [Gammaproteobacteria bacterium]